MKGRKLTLQEVLGLEDGTKVWVEDSRKGYRNTVCKYDKTFKYLSDIIDDLKSHYDLGYIGDYEDRLTFYEWIEEEPKEIISTYKSVSEIMESMATEIVNLRGLDLTDDNIRLIVKEFMEEK